MQHTAYTIQQMSVGPFSHRPSAVKREAGRKESTVVEVVGGTDLTAASCFPCASVQSPLPDFAFFKKSKCLHLQQLPMNALCYQALGRGLRQAVPKAILMQQFVSKSLAKSCVSRPLTHTAGQQRQGNHAYMTCIITLTHNS